MNIPAIRRVLDALECGGAIWLSFNNHWYRVRGGVIERSQFCVDGGSLDKVGLWVKAGFTIGEIVDRIRDTDKIWLPDPTLVQQVSHVRRVEL